MRDLIMEIQQIFGRDLERLESKVRKKMAQIHRKIHSNQGVGMVFEIPSAASICDQWKIGTLPKNPDSNGDLDQF